MRIGLVMFAAAALAPFAAAYADTVDSQTVQGPEAAAVVSAPPAATEKARDVPVSEIADQQEPESAAASESLAVEPTAGATPAAADSATPGEAADSQSIVLKMATVPPPADFKVPAGYRPVKRGLDTVYCTSITPIGSRMTKTYCLTREQVEERERQAETLRQIMREKARVGGTSGE